MRQFELLEQMRTTYYYIDLSQLLVFENIQLLLIYVLSKLHININNTLKCFPVLLTLLIIVLACCIFCISCYLKPNNYLNITVFRLNIHKIVNTKYKLLCFLLLLNCVIAACVAVMWNRPCQKRLQQNKEYYLNTLSCNLYKHYHANITSIIPNLILFGGMPTTLYIHTHIITIHRYTHLNLLLLPLITLRLILLNKKACISDLLTSELTTIVVLYLSLRLSHVLFV